MACRRMVRFAVLGVSLSFAFSAALSGAPCASFYLDGETLRGDANNDGQVDIADQIFLAAYLFQGGAGPSCDLDPSDVDDNRAVNITDYINLGDFLWLGGDPPALPYPEPGCDCTEDDVDVCASPPRDCQSVIELIGASVTAWSVPPDGAWDYNWYSIPRPDQVRLLTRNYQFEDCFHAKTTTSWNIVW
ncbi:MAG: hypothetical protein ACUVYA_16365 [Planctomycetota bacterium]